ncbi:MAG: hypothetical protein FJZ01_27220 [Candidatus Sericytochromatia bacterium]|nr:hypothetical protein [Candidatus Tanganyikabacteria bacterium]
MKGQLEYLARQIGTPSKMYQGTDTSDCVAASMQVQLARTQPAEYMRIAGGLIFDGKATLHGPDGGTSEIKLDKAAVWTSDGRKVRETTSELIQQSFMSYARKRFPPQPGDKNPPGGARGVFGGKGGGLTMREAEGLYENLTGRYASALAVTPGNRDAATQAVVEAARDGRSFQIGLGSDEGGHMVTLLGVRKDAKGRLMARFSDSETGSSRLMKWDKFKQLIDGIVLPSEFADPFVGARTGSSDDHGGGAIPTDPSAIGRGTTAPAPTSGGRRGTGGSALGG